MIAWLLVYLVVIAVVGLALVAALFGSSTRRSLAEIVGWSLALGCGAVGMILLWASMAGFKPTRAIVLGIGAVGAITLIVLRRRLPRIETPVLSPWNPNDWLTIASLVLVALNIFAATIVSFVPAFETDAIATWGFKAKVMYFQPLTPRPDYFSDVTLSYSHLDYPLLVPALWAGAYATIGEAHDTAKTVLIVPLIALAAMLYASLRERIDRPRASALLACAMGLMVIGWYAGRGLADVLLAMFMLGAVIALIRSNALLAGMSAGLAAMTKLEGWPIVVSVGIVMLARVIARRDRRGVHDLICVAASGALILVPWLLWSAGLPHTHENYQERLRVGSIVAGLDRTSIIVSATAKQLWMWSAIAPIVICIVAAIVGWRAWKRRNVLALWFVLFVQLASYLAVFMVAPWDIQQLADFSIHRLLLHVAPIMVLLAAMHWKEVIERPKRRV